MIKSFKHKGLKKFFEYGDVSGIQTAHAKKIYKILSAIDGAETINFLKSMQGFNLHPLKGDKKSLWSITVNGNWRITFEFIDKNAYILDYQDYH